jgi:hypothetical protein
MEGGTALQHPDESGGPGGPAPAEQRGTGQDPSDDAADAPRQQPGEGLGGVGDGATVGNGADGEAEDGADSEAGEWQVAARSNMAARRRRRKAHRRAAAAAASSVRLPRPPLHIGVQNALRFILGLRMPFASY